MSTDLSTATVQINRTPVTILGIPFDQVTTTDAVHQIEQMIASGKPHQLATANVDFIVQARRDLELRRVLFEADMIFGDGTPVVWASRWLGNPLPERVAGSDLVPRLIELAANKGYRVFLLGATPQAAAQAGDKLRKKYPSLSLDHYSPPFKPLAQMDHAEILRRIHEAKPDLLFVSFGCPKQEKWIAMHREKLGVPVAIGVGATIDFLAGNMKRAPRWMQRSGTEWIFRLLQEPRRLFKRYAMDFRVFGLRMIQQLWTFQWRKSGKTDSASPACSIQVSSGFLKLPEHFDLAAVNQTANLFPTLIEGRRIVRIDAGDLKFIDSSGIGLFIRLEKELSARGGHLVFTRASRELRRALEFMRLDPFFSFVPDETLLGKPAFAQQT